MLQRISVSLPRVQRLIIRADWYQDSPSQNGKYSFDNHWQLHSNDEEQHVPVELVIPRRCASLQISTWGDVTLEATDRLESENLIEVIAGSLTSRCSLRGDRIQLGCKNALNLKVVEGTQLSLKSLAGSITAKRIMCKLLDLDAQDDVNIAALYASEMAQIASNTKNIKVGSLSGRFYMAAPRGEAEINLDSLPKETDSSIYTKNGATVTLNRSVLPLMVTGCRRIAKGSEPDIVLEENILRTNQQTVGDKKTVSKLDVRGGGDMSSVSLLTWMESVENKMKSK